MTIVIDFGSILFGLAVIIGGCAAVYVVATIVDKVCSASRWPPRRPKPPRS